MCTMGPNFEKALECHKRGRCIFCGGDNIIDFECIGGPSVSCRGCGASWKLFLKDDDPSVKVLLYPNLSPMEELASELEKNDDV